MAVAQRIDSRRIEAHDRGRVSPVVEYPAVVSRDIDLVANDNIAQKTEMRIAVRGIDRRSPLTGIGCQFDMARTEGQRLPAASGKHDGAGAKPLDLDARDRPGIRP